MNIKNWKNRRKCDSGKESHLTGWCDGSVSTHLKFGVTNIYCVFLLHGLNSIRFLILQSYNANVIMQVKTNFFKLIFEVFGYLLQWFLTTEGNIYPCELTQYFILEGILYNIIIHNTVYNIVHIILKWKCTTAECRYYFVTNVVFFNAWNPALAVLIGLEWIKCFIFRTRTGQRAAKQKWPCDEEEGELEWMELRIWSIPGALRHGEIR